MYAAALEKIGGYLKEKINYDDNRATVTWYKLKAGAFDVLKQDIIGTTEEEIKDLAQGTYEDIRDKKMTAIEVPSMDDIKKNSKIFDYIQTERIKKSDFDSIFNGTIVKGLNTAYANVQKFNAEVLKAAHKASPTLKWELSREIVGSLAMHYKDIDGVILLTVYPCALDSMVNDMIMRKNKMAEIPLLQLTLDAQSGMAGLETRLESFIDIITMREEQEDHGEE
jgi:predicted transcriptional regulator